MKQRECNSLQRALFFLNKIFLNLIFRDSMNNKNAMILVVFLGMLLLTGLLLLQTCNGPASSELPGSFRLVIKASCPISKDEQQFMTDIKLLSTTFSAGSSSERFYIPNLSLVRIDETIPTLADSATFDIATGLMHYFKATLVQGAQFRDMRQDEEQIYFAKPENDPRFTDFRTKALLGHREEGEEPIVNCLDSNEYFMVDVLPPNPPCLNKYFNDLALLKKHLEKQFGVKAPTKDVVIYYLCGGDKPALSKVENFKDTDGDSVENSKDDCPDKAGKPVHNGCPDIDNDGVKDEWDLCPDVAGDATNGGCPSSKTPNQQEQNPKVPVRKVNITHNNNTGQFTVTNFDAKSMTSEVTIRLRNRKEIKVTPSSYIFPASKPEFNKLTQNISEGAGLYVVFNVFDLNTKEVISTFSLSDVSLVCIPSSNGQGTECGFVKM
jgi:hypothetical protein